MQKNKMIRYSKLSKADLITIISNYMANCIISNLVYKVINDYNNICDFRRRIYRH